MPDCSCYVTVKPKSPRTEVRRNAEGVLIRVAAPPVEGAANIAAMQALAAALGVPKSRVEITAGATSRLKRMTIRGMSQEELEARLAGLPAG